jgi:hypothetical protein
MNLEGMSVSEFDRSTRKILREFKSRPTKGMSWDYEADTTISSYEEKPVEAASPIMIKYFGFPYNAGGIVPIMVDSFQFYQRLLTQFQPSMLPFLTHLLR